MNKKAIKAKNKSAVGLEGIYTFTLENIHTGEKKVYRVKNLIPTCARTAIAQHLSNASPTPSTLRINYSALGTGTTAPANGDTTLETESYRKLISSETNADNIAYFTAFYTAVECNGTYREAGLFINGTGTIDTGTLFSRVAINITKTVSETLTIDYTVTIS